MNDNKNTRLHLYRFGGEPYLSTTARRCRNTFYLLVYRAFCQQVLSLFAKKWQNSCTVEFQRKVNSIGKMR